MLLLSCQRSKIITHPNHESELQDSTNILCSYNQPSVELPDSVRITIEASQFGWDPIVFSINNNLVDTINLSYSYYKQSIIKSNSIQLLKKINDLFIAHNEVVIKGKKYLPEIAVSDLPCIKFEIFNGGKILNKEYTVGNRQGHYEIVYSDYFLELFNQLYNEAEKIYTKVHNRTI